MPVPTSYDTPGTHPHYECSDCGITGVKLWRLYNTFLSHQHLRCASCACQEYDLPDSVDPNGKSVWEGLTSDTINGGSMIPAVPTEDGDTYWGYTSVPQAGVDWWRQLPVKASGQPATDKSEA